MFMLNKAKLADRKERMRQQLQQDAMKIQQELAAQGLAIVSVCD